MKREIIIVTEDELNSVEDKVKKTLVSGAFRIGIVVIAQNSKKGDIVGRLRTILKGNISPQSVCG